MKNPRSDPAPGASSTQGSGEAFARIEGRDVETTSAWTGEKKARFQSNTSDIEGWDWDDDMLREDMDSYFKRYHGLPDNGDDDAWAPLSDQQLKDMQERLALCRIKAHKMLEGEVRTIAELRNMYSPSMLEENGYFRWYERDFEWYFDPEYCQFACLEDYQRLALPNTGEYLHWEYYHNTCSTLKSDQDYIYFWETLSSKTKWFQNFSSTDPNEWKRAEDVIFYHAVRIAKECTHIFTPLLHSGYSEYLWSVKFDMTWYKDFAYLHFEIWKLVSKQKMSFKDALDQVKEKGMQSMCCFELEFEFDSDKQSWPGPITHQYNTYVAGIDENLQDDEAYELVMDAVKIFCRKLKSYYDYAKNKLDIAEKIGLIPPQPS